MTGALLHWIDRRAVPPAGYDVHAYDYPGIAQVVLLLNREIANQWSFKAGAEAFAYARQLADKYRCALIRHEPRAGEERE